MPGVLPWLSLVFLGLLSFANAVPHPFVHDDIVFIAQNPQIAHLDHLSSVFLPLHQQGPQGINAYYRPVLEIIYRLEYRAFGFNAHGFHLVNVLLHIANGLLVFGLLRRLRFTPAIAWVVSALFLVHPLQSEAVACIAGISNLAMALMVLLTLHAYLSRWYVLTFLLFIAALLTKEQALMLPLLMVGLDIDQGRARRSYGMWAVWVMTGILFLWFRHVVSGSSVLADVMQSPGELLLRLKAIGPVLLTDLRLIVAPYDLHYYRNYDISVFL